ncbi:aspartate kinase [Coleofasciculus sp. FACHB-1120]|uniref:aspartate kinase n=1 Tax=Coleofasciculus sp. FACHB-1120 TaxID=2692783 RepID=UPI00168A3B34|nr:aspartate kinase [Coleofasciculus sp. FACHB-1120]MBD2740432.1 aspartate kinase [Coleofasciculus sp. FACHB-1120]
MALIVQKYGGTSVGSVERIQAVAQRVLKTAQMGNSLVVVVSAMGKTTDGLVKLANQISTNPSRREMDMLLSTGEQVSIALLSMALQELGQPAVSLTGAQVGIVTEAEHTRARILHIQTHRVERHLDAGKVVVVAGFQGITSTEDLEITTLGRGGSDTSAVALAAALRASCCEIYTDVPGIFTTDPRLVPEAQLMGEITSDEMLELASLGAKVLHPRAVEIARNYGVELVVRSSWTDDPGTRVISPMPKPRSLQDLEIARPVDGVEFDTDQAKIALLRVPDRPGVAARLFGEIAHQALDIDLIIQSIHEGNTNDIAFTVSKNVINRAEAVAAAIAPALRNQNNPEQGEAEVMVDRQIAKVSIAGAGMIGRPGVAAQMFATLSSAGINIQMISTSEVKVSCVIDADDCDRAIALLCQTFEVNNSPLHQNRIIESSLAEQSRISTQSSVLHPQHSAPPVRGVALDFNQARLAIRHIPDRPGMAAQVFGLLAEKNVSVDMIIQSQRCRVVNGIATRDIAFTVAQADAAEAKSALEKLAPSLGCGEVLVDTAIAKVSIVGSGMVGQPGIAAQMFEALSQHQINIQMITTSEIKISCVVAENQGVTALQAIHAAFGLAGSQKIQVPA